MAHTETLWQAKNLQKWLKTYFWGFFEGGCICACCTPPGSATDYQPTQAIISKTHPIIRHLIFRHLNNSRYYQTHHVIINTSTYYPYSQYHTIIFQCSPRSLWPGFKSRSGKKFFGPFLRFSKTVILNMIVVWWVKYSTHIDTKMLASDWLL